MVLDFDEIELKSVIGSGTFATVFRGLYRYKIAKPGDVGGDKKMVRVSTIRYIVVVVEGELYGGGYIRKKYGRLCERNDKSR